MVRILVLGIRVSKVLTYERHHCYHLKVILMCSSQSQVWRLQVPWHFQDDCWHGQPRSSRYRKGDPWLRLRPFQQPKIVSVKCVFLSNKRSDINVTTEGSMRFCLMLSGINSNLNTTNNVNYRWKYWPPSYPKVLPISTELIVPRAYRVRESSYRLMSLHCETSFL